MSKKVLITSALPYANGQLHFGHIAGAYLPADCYARFERLQGSDVLYICGSDEFGVAITLSADLAGRTPQDHIDLFHHLNHNLFAQLNFSFDHFSRTSWKGHAVPVHQFFNDLLANGYIEQKVTDQLYAPQDHRFLADRYVVGTCPKCHFHLARGDECQRCGASYEATDLKEPRSKLTGAPLILKPTEHWFIRFEMFQSQLSSWLASKPWKPNVFNFAKSYVENLRPRAITRDGDWGVPIPLPQTEGKIFYVWFDAPIGYISATQEWAQLRGTPEAWKSYWLDSQTTYVQFIGKDNIPFHAVFFPAMIMGQNIPYKLVDHLVASEFLTLEGRQFSKSDGWTIDLGEFFQHFTADQIRYLLAANSPETQDSEFTWRDFQTRCNSELLGKYGNYVNRVLLFLQHQSLGHVPARGSLHERDEIFLDHVRHLATQIQEAYQTFHLRRAAALIMELAQTGNGYFDQKKPWSLAKTPEGRPQMETTVHCAVESLQILALVSSPILPHTAQRLWEMVGNTSDLSRERWSEVLALQMVEGKELPPPHVLFHRVEDDVIEKEENKLHALLASFSLQD